MCRGVMDKRALCPSTSLNMLSFVMVLNAFLPISFQKAASEAAASYGAGRVSLAAVNGPDSVVLSGPRRLVEAVATVALEIHPHGSPLAVEDQSGRGHGACDVRAAKPTRKSISVHNNVEQRNSSEEDDETEGRRRNKAVCSSELDNRPLSDWLTEPQSSISAKECVMPDGSESTRSISVSTDSEGAQDSSDSLLEASPPASGAPSLTDDGVEQEGRSIASHNGKGTGIGEDRSIVSENSHTCRDQASVLKPLSPDAPSGTGAAADTDGTSGLFSMLESYKLPVDRFRILDGVSRAFHSPAMTEAAAGVEVAASKISLRDPSIPVVSNVTGEFARDGLLTEPSYWSSHVLGTVRFYDGLKALTRVDAGNGRAATPGIETLVEVGPSALLCGIGRRALRAVSEREGSTRNMNGKRRDDYEGVRDVAPSPRWIAAMSAGNTVMGKSGLGHVVGAIKGVHYRRRRVLCRAGPRTLFYLDARVLAFKLRFIIFTKLN